MVFLGLPKNLVNFSTDFDVHQIVILKLVSADEAIPVQQFICNSIILAIHSEKFGNIISSGSGEINVHRFSGPGDTESVRHSIEFMYGNHSIVEKTKDIFGMFKFANTWDIPSLWFACLEQFKKKLALNPNEILEFQNMSDLISSQEWQLDLVSKEFDKIVCVHADRMVQHIIDEKFVKTPSFCACGERNTLDHSLICKKGGFVSMRHNQIRDLEANLMSEVCKDVQREPQLLPLSGETFEQRSTNTAAEARLDISARGIWNTVDKTFFDVRIFHPGAGSNKAVTIDAAFEKHESEKKRMYNRRVLEVEKATFTPLVFSTTGGMGKEAELFHKRLASLIAEKRNTSYSDCMAYLRKKLSFCLVLRTVLAALRGYRGRPVSVEGCNIDINLLNSNEIVQY